MWLTSNMVTNVTRLGGWHANAPDARKIEKTKHGKLKMGRR